MAEEHDIDSMEMHEADVLGFSTSPPSSMPVGVDGGKNSRLARKAESARHARLRHKQFVDGLQRECSSLRERVRELEVRATGPHSAAGAVAELKAALAPEQTAQLLEWLVAAQGENHVLQRAEAGAALPPPPSSVPPPPMSMASSAPTNIPDPGGRMGASPEEGVFSLSRSHNDEVVALSILNLNSPNGFHPLPIPTGAHAMPPPLALLPTASVPVPGTGGAHDANASSSEGNGVSMIH